MTEIWYASLLWVVTHLAVSSTLLRPVLVKRVGERGYLAAYTLLAVASLGYLIWVYSDVPRVDYWWEPNISLYWPAKLLLPLACIFLVGGFMVKNPTLVGMTLTESQAHNLAKGVTRITRHPFQWAVIVWGVTHVIANGDGVSVIFFGSFVVLSGVGSMLMDVKKSQTMGEAWRIYASVTSNVPFWAILRGKNKLVLSELWLPIAVGLATYVGLFFFHEAITGAVVV